VATAFTAAHSFTLALAWYGIILGVETGQLSVIAFLYGPLIWWANKPWYLKSNRFCSAMILLVASWWVIQRIFLE